MTEFELPQDLHQQLLAHLEAGDRDGAVSLLSQRYQFEAGQPEAIVDQLEADRIAASAPTPNLPPPPTLQPIEPELPAAAEPAKEDVESIQPDQIWNDPDVLSSLIVDARPWPRFLVWVGIGVLAVGLVFGFLCFQANKHPSQSSLQEISGAPDNVRLAKDSAFGAQFVTVNIGDKQLMVRLSGPKAKEIRDALRDEAQLIASYAEPRDSDPAPEVYALRTPDRDILTFADKSSLPRRSGSAPILSLSAFILSGFGIVFLFGSIQGHSGEPIRLMPRLWLGGIVTSLAIAAILILPLTNPGVTAKPEFQQFGTHSEILFKWILALIPVILSFPCLIIVGGVLAHQGEIYTKWRFLFRMFTAGRDYPTLRVYQIIGLLGFAYMVWLLFWVAMKLDGASG